MSRPVLLVLCGDAKRRASFARALSEAGWEGVLSASSLSDATSLIHDAPNVCIVIDLELQDMPGLNATRILRNLCPHVKAIFTTPENTRDLEEQVRALGVFYYHVGPADKAELIAAVKEAIGGPKPAEVRHPPKILIVDDDPDFHHYVRAVLGPAGYSTVSAYSEREGIEAARRERPDAILLDIIMGSTTDGFEFCHEVRRDPQIKHTPILGVSALEERIGVRGPPDREPDLFPVNGYLRKPVAPERLVAELRNLIPAEE
jgi:CheY-like chemotaxis protein